MILLISCRDKKHTPFTWKEAECALPPPSKVGCGNHSPHHHHRKWGVVTTASTTTITGGVVTTAPTTTATTSGVVTASTNVISGVVPVMTPLLPIRTIDPIQTIDQELEELKYVLKSQEKERQIYEKQRQQNEKERIEAEKERCAAQATRCADPSQSIPAPPDNPVREWKRCEEALGLKAPPGRVPLCTATA